MWPRSRTAPASLQPFIPFDCHFRPALGDTVVTAVQCQFVFLAFAEGQERPAWSKSRIGAFQSAWCQHNISPVGERPDYTSVLHCLGAGTACPMKIRKGSAGGIGGFVWHADGVFAQRNLAYLKPGIGAGKFHAWLICKNRHWLVVQPQEQRERCCAQEHDKTQGSGMGRMVPTGPRFAQSNSFHQPPSGFVYPNWRLVLTAIQPKSVRHWLMSKGCQGSILYSNSHTISEKGK